MYEDTEIGESLIKPHEKRIGKPKAGSIYIPFEKSELTGSDYSNDKKLTLDN